LKEHLKLFNVKENFVVVQSLTSKISDITAQIAKVSFVPNVRKETGYMKRKTLKIKNVLYADTKTAEKS